MAIIEQFFCEHHLIDLTLPMSDDMPSCPGEPGGVFVPFATMAIQGFVSHQLLLYTHLGTHVDAPNHFAVSANGVDDWDVTQLCGPAMVVRPRADAPRDLLPDSLLWPRPPRAGDRLIIATGWDAHWGHPEYFHNFPQITEELGTYLADRRIAMLALDTPTPHDDKAEALHRTLLGANVVVVEGLARAHSIPGSFGAVFCLPLPLAGLDGSPARVIFVAEGNS